MEANLSQAETPHKPKLLEQVRRALRLRHYSIRTEQTYLDWMRKFILYHGKRHPEEMGEAEVGAFLSVPNSSLGPRWVGLVIHKPVKAAELVQMISLVMNRAASAA